MLMSNRFTHRGGTSWSMCISTSCSTVIGTNAAKMGAKLSAALGIAVRQRREPLGSGAHAGACAPTCRLPLELGGRPTTTFQRQPTACFLRTFSTADSTLTSICLPCVVGAKGPDRAGSRRSIQAAPEPLPNRHLFWHTESAPLPLLKGIGKPPSRRRRSLKRDALRRACARRSGTGLLVGQEQEEARREEKGQRQQRRGA